MRFDADFHSKLTQMTRTSARLVGSTRGITASRSLSFSYDAKLSYTVSDPTHGSAGGLGAVAGRLSGCKRVAWANATLLMARTDGAHVSTFQIGATSLSHLEAKPVGTRLGTAVPGENLLIMTIRLQS